MSAIPERGTYYDGFRDAMHSVSAAGSSSGGDGGYQPIDVSELGTEGELAVNNIEYWARYATEPGVRTDCVYVLEYIRTLHDQIAALELEAQTVAGAPSTFGQIWDVAHDAGWNDAQNDRNGHPRRITPNPYRKSSNPVEVTL